MLTGNPALDPWLVAQLAAPFALALLGNGALVVVAATAAKQRPGDGWLWLMSAGVFGLMRLVSSPVSTAAFSLLSSRQGVDAMIKANAALSVIGALVGSIWWLLLVVGIAKLCAPQPPEPPAQR